MSQQTKGEKRNSGRHLVDLIRESRRMALSKFRETYGDGFMLLYGKVDLDPTVGSGATINLSSNRRKLRQKGIRPQLDFWVFPVRKCVTANRSAFITLGRGEMNDICLRHNSVSRVHALVVDRQDGFYLLDAGSSNGTFLNDHRVPDKHTGGPILIPAGAQLGVGVFDLMFMHAHGLRDMMGRLTGTDSVE
ncbi:FHA domain-containing protein [Myxococcota bacterium]